MCFAFLKEIRNSKWPPFLMSEIFVDLERLVFTDTLWVKKILKTGSPNQQLPVGQKFRRNRSIAPSVFKIQAFLCFAFLRKDSKWPPFLASEIFVEAWKG